MIRMSGAGLLHDVLGAIHNITPGASMPMIVSRKIQNPGALDIERDVVIVRQLIQEMARVGSFISASAIVRAAHVCPRADTLIWPAIPLPIRIQANRNHRRFDCPAVCSGHCGQTHGSYPKKQFAPARLAHLDFVANAPASCLLPGKCKIFSETFKSRPFWQKINNRQWL